MLKYTLLFFAMSLSVCRAQNKSSFAIAGHLKNMKENIQSVQLYFIQNGQAVLDSAKVVNGSYSFKGDLAEPTISRLRAIPTKTPANPNNQEKYLAFVFLQPNKMTITSVDSFSNVTVIGSPAHNDFKKLQALSKPYVSQMQGLYSKYSQYRNSGDIVNLRKTELQLDSIAKEMQVKVFASFITAHPNSPVSVFALQQYSGSDNFDVAELEPIYNALGPEVQNLPSAKAIKERIDIYKRTSIGQEALDFTQNDTSGVPVSLSSFRGKYLLVDFWASWCQPCRQENPNVVKAFNRFKSKGFYILSVSLDRADGKEKWIKAIHDDSLTWSHVSDLQYWNNAVAKLYGIQAIPQNLLLDPSGKIIGKNLRGEELERKLEEILGNQ